MYYIANFKRSMWLDDQNIENINRHMENAALPNLPWNKNKKEESTKYLNKKNDQYYRVLKKLKNQSNTASNKIKLGEKLLNSDIVQKDPNKKEAVKQRLLDLERRKVDLDLKARRMRDLRLGVTSRVYDKAKVKEIAKQGRIIKAKMGILGLGVLGAGVYTAKKLRDSRSDKGKLRGIYNKLKGK